MTLHYAPTTPEEEELALALALSASLSSAAVRLPSPATSSRPAPGAAAGPSTSTSSGGTSTIGSRPPHPPTAQLSARQNHTCSSSSSSSPARPRWPIGTSAPASPKAAGASSVFSPIYPRGPGSPGSQSPLRAGSRSKASPGRPSVRPGPPPPVQPPPAGSAQRAPPQPSSSSQQPPRFPPVAPAAVIPRSRSATGPNGMLGAASSSSSAGPASSSSCGGAPPSSRPQQPPSGQQPAAAVYNDPDACAGCGRGFGLFHNRTWITGMGRKWHAGCFRCGFCKQPISDGLGSFSYQMHPSDPLPYHPDCYRRVHHPLCQVCGSYIPANADGVISYRENGFWRERYCPAHVDSELRRCCACSRLQKQGEEWAPLPDDRPLCLQCVSSVVLDTQDAQPLYDEVLAFYRNEMKLPHPYKPPLLLVDGPTLNSHAQAEGRDDSAGAPVFHVRGLCVATMYSHIPSILRGIGGTIRSVSTEISSPRGPAAGGRGSGGGAGGSSGGTGSSQPQQVHCHVKVILLLYGLPRLLSGSIMAHELMHAWLRMEGVVGLPMHVEEGLCQLMACLWLDRQHELLKGKPEEQRLASFFSYQIRTDTSDVYGGGFREALEAFQTYGISAVLRNVKRYGRFTPPS